MKKYIGYTILALFLIPVGVLAVLLAWPLPLMIALMEWLFDDDRKMEPAGYVCGILATFAWLFVLCYLSLLVG